MSGAGTGGGKSPEIHGGGLTHSQGPVLGCGVVFQEASHTRDGRSWGKGLGGKGEGGGEGPGQIIAGPRSGWATEWDSHSVADPRRGVAPAGPAGAEGLRPTHCFFQQLLS